MPIYSGKLAPYQITTDPDKGFVGFNVLKGIRGNEALALEWAMGIYKEIDVFRPILIEEFIENVPDGEVTLESLIEKGYLVPTGINVMPSEQFVNSALFVYSRKRAPKPGELARRERQHIVDMVERLIGEDPDCQVTRFIVSRMYGAHGTCRGVEDLEAKLAKMEPWISRGYYVVNIAEINRSLPVSGQIPEMIEWKYPEHKK